MDEEIKQDEWDEIRKSGIKNREQFVGLFPTMKDWVEKGEALYGAFEGTTSITFKDGRICFMTKFENLYWMSFHNPELKAKGDKEDSQLNLSPEGMYAVEIMFNLFKSEKEQERFYSAIGMTEEDILIDAESESKEFLGNHAKTE